MARRIRSGLDYFPLDTSWDLNMRLLKAQYGLEGLGVIIQLQQMIYNEGYALTWNDETRHLFCSENGIDQARLDMILEFSFNHEIFNRGLLERCSVLSSWEIQRQWMKICADAKRKSFEIADELNLCPKETSSHNAGQEKDRGGSVNAPEYSGKFPEYSGVKHELSKERKVNKNKEYQSGSTELSGAAPQNRQDIPALIRSLAAEKRVVFDDAHGMPVSLSQRFQKLIQKDKKD